MSVVIQQIYVALFGRPADPGGLAYWDGVTKNGADLSSMLNVLPALPEYTGRFANLSNAQIVNSIYQSLFGRDADPAGLNFFVGQLSSGAQTIGTIAVNILQGAQGVDKALIDAKVAAAAIFTAHLDLPGEISAYSGDAAAVIGRNYITGITVANPGTEANADAAIVRLPGVSGGQGPGGVADDAGPNGSPVFTSAGTASVNENAPTTTVVYKATATDDNPGAVTYSLVGTDAGAFTIDPRTGEVRFVNSPDFETKAVYNIGVKAQDTTGFASTKGVVITVNDVVENTSVDGTAGADTINKAGSLNNWTIDGKAGADTLTGGLGNDIINGGDTVTVTNNPGTPGTYETISFTLTGTTGNGWSDGWNPPGNGTRDIVVVVPGSGQFNDVTLTYGASNRDTASEVATGLRTALNAISGYDAVVQDSGTSINVTLTATTVGDKSDGFSVSNGGSAVTVTKVDGSAAVVPFTTYTVTEASPDVLTGGAGADTFVFAASTTGALDRITDFNVGQGDKIDFANFGAASYRGTFTGTGVNIDSMLNNALSTLNTGEAGLFNWGGRAFVVYDANGGGFTPGADQIIEVTGLTGTLSQANFI